MVVLPQIAAFLQTSGILCIRFFTYFFVYVYHFFPLSVCLHMADAILCIISYLVRYACDLWAQRIQFLEHFHKFVGFRINFLQVG